jgi:catechol 2,3-dioxygenase-like lactoylglutathione lyase family enzyme
VEGTGFVDDASASDWRLRTPRASSATPAAAVDQQERRGTLMANLTSPSLRVTSVTIGTSMPRELARFYSVLLTWPVTALEEAGPGEPENAGWAQVRPPESVSGPTLNFEFERHFRRPVWPAVAGEQTASQHLDIRVDDLEAGVDWALACGAILDEVQPQEKVRVMRDPDGHPFCLFL